MNTNTTTASGTISSETQQAVQLQPYVFFYGRCEEALEFYKNVFGGTYEIMRIKDSPMRDQSPSDAAERVMHASFKAPGVNFLASDGRDVKAIDPDTGNISLSLNITDKTQGERVFNALAQGGKVTMPLEEAFWGGRFGSVEDRFGNEWLIATP